VWPVAVVLAAAMAYALFLYLPTRTTTSSSSAPQSVAAPGVHQADWDMNTFPAGGAGLGRLNAKAKTRIAEQREPVAALVRDVYDALFLEPSRAEQVLATRFESGAGTSALSKKIGLPAGAKEVKITKRTARIGIYMADAKTAAARVELAGTAVKNGHRSSFKHRSTLWLERAHHKWKIIGFDITQGPRT
jgi:hypothetical protein